MAELSPLRRRMIEDHAEAIRNMSPATTAVLRSAPFRSSAGISGRSPDKLTLDVTSMPSRSISYRQAFQLGLGSNQIVCALRFFYGVTLGEAAVPERIPYAREPRKLPIVLSADEGRAISRSRFEV